MIKFANDYIQSFIDYLNGKYATNEDVQLFIVPPFFACDTVDDLGGFYEENSNTIVVLYNPEWEGRDDVDLQIMGVIAHEYRHYLAEKNGEEQNEQKCDDFAYKVIEEFTKGKVKKGE